MVTLPATPAQGRSHWTSQAGSRAAAERRHSVALRHGGPSVPGMDAGERGDLLASLLFEPARPLACVEAKGIGGPKMQARGF